MGNPACFLPLESSSATKEVCSQRSLAMSASILTDTYKLGFIGAGKMAESIARGVVKSGVLPASRIRTSHKDSGRRDAFSSFGVKVFDNNQEV